MDGPSLRPTRTMSPQPAIPSTDPASLAFIGGGNMARSLIGGLIATGRPSASIRVGEPNQDLRDALVRDFAIVASADNASAVADASVWLLAVKPQVLATVCRPLAEIAGQHRPLVISIAAGIASSQIERWLGGELPVVRAMPNTPALVGAGMTGLFANPRVDATGRALAERLLAAVGRTAWVEDEALMDVVTAVSGSGPAYVFLFIEALEQAAAELGFTPEQGRQLAVGTVQGAAALAAQSAEPASLLRERVTSKGGTTEAALGVMNERGVREGIVAGVKAAEARGRELGRLLGAN